MKKSKLSLCLTSGFVAAMSLTACAVSAKEGVVLTVKDANGNTQEVGADAFYDKSKTSSDGASKFYDAVLEALIRYEYKNPNDAVKNWKKAIKTYEKIEEEAKDKVKNDKETAKENANTNGTSYETEWEKILSSHNCLPDDDDSESGESKLLQYYIYQLEKEDIEDKYFIDQKDNLTKEWLGVDSEGKKGSNIVNGVFPYHIRHVLTSIAGGSTNFYDATLTEDEAKNLGNTMAALLDSNYKFADVATKFSGDSGSAAKGGDVGVMTTSTSFVNEFKLGIYAYDSIYNHNTNETKNDVIREGVGLDADYKFSLRNTANKNEKPTATNAIEAFGSKINNGKLQEVPFDAFLKIRDEAETTTDDNGKAVNDGNEHYYPRNILFNYYLNFHNPFVITNETLDYAGTGLVSGTSDAYAARFVEMTVNGVAKKVLCDENKNVIIGCRSEHGIHFMIMERSIYSYSEGGTGKDAASLAEYFTTVLPSDSDFPKQTDKKTNKDSYVGFIETKDASTYTTRSNEISSSLKSFDSAYSYRLFEYLLSIEDGKVSINNESLKPIKDTIASKISEARKSNAESSKKSLNEAWRTYAELCALQYENRTDWTGYSELTTEDTFRTIHPRCAVGFKSHSGDAWNNEKGVCYYAK